MKLHAACFCIKVPPQSIALETHVVTLPCPRDGFDGADDAWLFCKAALSAHLPQNVDPEDKLLMCDDDGDEQGYFFSCSVPTSDEHYHVLLKYSLF